MQPTLNEFNRNAYRYLFLAVVLILTTGTVFYHHVEHLGWLDAYYFSVITLATVGYGDIVPHTPLGKLFTTFYIFIGVGIITTFFTYTIRRQADRRMERQAKKSHKNEAG
jgi:voltage-gated potassium channel